MHWRRIAILLAATAALLCVASLLLIYFGAINHRLYVVRLILVFTLLAAVSCAFGQRMAAQLADGGPVPFPSWGVPMAALLLGGSWLTVAPRLNTGEHISALYARLSVDFPINFNLPYSARPLSPTISNIFFLNAEKYYLFTYFAAFLFCLLVIYYFHNRLKKENHQSDPYFYAVVAVCAALTLYSTTIYSANYHNGTPEIISFMLIMVFIFIHDKNPIYRILIYILLVANHEFSVFAFPFLVLYHVRSLSIVAILRESLLALPAFAVLFALKFWIANINLEQGTTGLGASDRSELMYYAKKHFGLFAGSVTSIGFPKATLMPLWTAWEFSYVLVGAAMVLAWRARDRYRVCLIGAALVFPFFTFALGGDYTRYYGLAFPAFMLAAVDLAGKRWGLGLMVLVLVANMTAPYCTHRLALWYFRCEPSVLSVDVWRQKFEPDYWLRR